MPKEKGDSLLDNPNKLLDQLVKARGLNHARIERRLGVHQQTWISYRKNPAVMSLGKFVKVARLLKVDLDELWKVMTAGREMDEDKTFEDDL